MSCPADPFLADSRQRLIQAAAEAFREEGYRASVERIAARAGVAKQTFYNHFPGKEDLFAEVARQGAASILVTLDEEGKSLRETLLAFATAFAAKVLSAEGLAFFRTMVAEAARMPELAASCFRGGPEQTAAGLADFIGRAMAEGRLRRDDPRVAAELLLGMVSGFERTRRLFCQPASTPVAEAARLEASVDCFLRAYAPERSTS